MVHFVIRVGALCRRNDGKFTTDLRQATCRRCIARAWALDGALTLAFCVAAWAAFSLAFGQ